jgi:RHS repeat-associated protein
MTDPDGHVTSYVYDTYGDLTKSTDALGNVTSATFNVDGLKTSSTTPDGNVAGANASAFTTSYAYDGRGRLLSSIDPLGNTTARGYDGDGNVVSATAPDHQSTTYSYNADDQLLKTTQPDGAVNQNGYDGSGNLVTQTNADNQSTTYGYNLAGEQTSRTDSLSHTTTYAYDPAGNLVGQTNAADRVTSYNYDADNHLIGVTYADGTTPVTYTYDANGQRTGMTDSTGATSYTYDSLGRLSTMETDGSLGPTVTYGYDLAGNEITLNYGISTETASWTYNAGNQMTSVTDWNGHTTGFTYDASGNLAAIAHPDGSTDTYSVNADSAITDVSAVGSNGTLYNLATPRNADGNVTAETAALAGTSQNTTTGYGYDASQRLSGTTVGTGTQATPGAGFTYDAADNLLTKSAGGVMVQTNTFNADSELTSSGNPTTQATTSFGYNPQGERTSETTTVAGQPLTTNLTWNQAGNLIGIAGPALSELNGQTGINESIQNAYNGDGLLASTDGGALSLTYDMVHAVPEIVSNGEQSWFRGPGGLVVEEATGGQAPIYYHHDQLGSTRALTDSDGRDLVNYTYTPYGLSKASVAGIANPFGFADSFTDPLSGLIDLVNRWYDPSSGQFLSLDPLVAVTHQPYAYAGEDPVNRTDPTGECACSPNPGQVLGGGVAGAAVGGTAGFGVGGGISAYLYGGSTTAAIINGTIDLAFPEVALGLSILQIAVIVGLGVGFAGGAFGAAQCSSSEPSPDIGTQDKTGPARTP